MRKLLFALILVILVSFVVFAADWYPVTFKHSWDRSASGFCPTDTQCLIDPAGDKNKNNQPEKYSADSPPECIADTQFIKDYYCDNGQWTSRTKLLALQFLDFAEKNSKDDFTLFCGPYKDALNNYEYIVDSVLVKNFLKDERVNNFCILNHKNGIAFGTSLNKDIDHSTYSFLKALNLSEDLCNNAVNNDNDFDSCTEKVWYNHDTKTIIYLDSGSLSTPSSGLLQKFIKNPFKSVLDYVYSVVHDPETLGKDFYVFNKTSIYNNLYIGRKSGKDIFAFMELEQSIPKQDYLAVKYSNINLGQSPCDNIIKLYGPDESKGRNAYCEHQTGSEFIVVAKKIQGEETPLISAWKDLTAKLR